MPFGNLVKDLNNLRVQVQGHVEGHVDRIREQRQAQQGQQQPPHPPPPQQQQEQQQTQLTPGAFETLRRRWTHQVVGDPSSIDHNDEEVKNIIKGISDNCNNLLRNWELSEDHVFKGIGPLVPQDMKFKNTYGKLLQMAIAWATEGTEQYQNQDVVDKIVAGLDRVYELIFDKGQAKVGECLKSRANWWAIQIGAPLNLADACVVLYDKIDPARRQRWGEAVVKVVGNTAIASLKGGNRAWIGRVLITTALYMDNPDVLRRGIATLSAEGGNVKQNTLFAYLEPGQGGEGLYRDGSLLSHDVYPYAGGYGLTMLGSVANLLNLLNSPESPPEFRITDPNVSITYESVERNFLPVTWNGMLFEHIRGREVSRVGSPGWIIGHGMIHSVAALAKGCTDRRMATYLESLVKHWSSANPMSPLEQASLSQRAMLRPILEDRQGPVARPLTGAFATPIQEHFVYHAPDSSWCFTLSLSSKRIGRAESLNEENTRSWYQGDGMTYFYTINHKTHYGDSYWPTMDPLHCPGTTNHQSEPPPPTYKSMGYRDWSGGACWAGGGRGDGVTYGSNGVGARFGAVSMDHYAADKRSAAKKSWFMVEDAIIALGAGCTGNAQSALHTTIESRNLNREDLAFFLDGQEQPKEKGWETQNNRASWAWLEEHAGYIFHDQERKIFSRTESHGNWNNINCNARAHGHSCCRTYLNIFIDHGIDPKISQYAYAVVPLASRERTQELAQNPHWTILQNVAELQAIENRFDNGYVTMVTFWTPGELNGIRVEQGCQLIWGRWGDNWCLTVSDPTQRIGRVVVNIAVGGLQQGQGTDGVSVNGNQVIFDGLKQGAAKSIFFKGNINVGGRRHEEL